MGFYQAKDADSFLSCLWNFQRSDDSEDDLASDDLASDDLPSILSAEVESDDGECSDNGSDADGLGDPFSDDSDSDC